MPSNHHNLPPPRQAAPSNGLACYDQARKNAVLSLDFTAKMKLAWGFARKCALPYLTIIIALYLLISILQGVISFAGLTAGFQALVFFPLVLMMLSFVGLYRCALRYLDGLESGFRWSCFLEPLSRPGPLLPLAALLALISLPIYLYLFIFSDWLVYCLLLVLCTFLPLLFEYNLLYAAEADGAGGMQILTIPFRLIRSRPKIWLSAVAGFGLGLLVTFIILFPASALLGMAGMLAAPETAFGTPQELPSNFYERLKETSNIFLIITQLAYFLFSLLVASALSVFSIFLFAIAYRQNIFAYNLSQFEGSGPCR